MREITKRLFTVDEYYQMAEAGILGPGDRVELIDGEIIQMSPIGDRHAGHVNRANHLFAGSFAGRAVVSVQNPIQLNKYTEPEPDVCYWALGFWAFDVEFSVLRGDSPS